MNFFSTLLQILESPSITFPAMALRVVISIFLGFLIGFERKIHMQNAGLRTHILICISSCLMMMISIYVPQVYAPNRGDPSRIAAQIVSGIGFLGGGAILRQGLNIRGLNSAATVWASAGIGMAVGAGMVVIAVFVSFLCIVCMFLFEKIGMKYFPADHAKQLELIFKNEKVDFQSLKAVLNERGIIVMNTDFSRDIDDQKIKIVYNVRTSDNLDIIALTENLRHIGKLEKVKLTD